MLDTVIEIMKEVDSGCPMTLLCVASGIVWPSKTVCYNPFESSIHYSTIQELRTIVLVCKLSLSSDAIIVE